MASEFRYPQYDLEQSIEVARKITARGTGATLSADELAAFLGYKSVNNGAFLTRMSSARLFGVIEGPSKAMAATTRATAIIHPDYPQTAERARLDAFQSVPLYGAFLDAFKGRELPDEQGMSNALVTRFKVPEKESKAVLTRLLASAEQAGLFRVAGSGRMIEPSPGSTPEGEAPAEPGPTQVVRPQSISSGRAFPKIIDGALDLMPSGPPWAETEYREWLSFFDQACRVYYRIARETKKVET